MKPYRKTGNIHWIIDFWWHNTTLKNYLGTILVKIP